MRKASLVAFALASCLSLTACGQSGSAQPERTVTVLAAASLTEPFHELGARFSAQHPGSRVEFDFQGSSTLAEQIEQGRQADIFASANVKNMDKVAASGLVRTPQRFATNHLVIVTAPGNPTRLDSIADLAAPGRSVVTCAQRVPCGAATDKVEHASGVRLKPVSEENDVKSVLRKVTAGEADAGLVYVTDARSAGSRVTAVDFPESKAATNSYVFGTLEDVVNPALAEEFASFVRGPVGREVLAKHGFGPP